MEENHFLGAQTLNPLAFQLTLYHQTCKIPWLFDDFPSDGPFFWGFPAMLQELHPPCHRRDQVVCRKPRRWCDGGGIGVGC